MIVNAIEICCFCGDGIGRVGLYQSNELRPTQLVTDLHEETIEQNNGCYITMTPLQDLQKRCR